MSDQVPTPADHARRVNAELDEHRDRLAELTHAFSAAISDEGYLSPTQAARFNAILSGFRECVPPKPVPVPPDAPGPPPTPAHPTT